MGGEEVGRGLIEYPHDIANIKDRIAYHATKEFTGRRLKSQAKLHTTSLYYSSQHLSSRKGMNESMKNTPAQPRLQLASKANKRTAMFFPVKSNLKHQQ